MTTATCPIGPRSGLAKVTEPASGVCRRVNRIHASPNVQIGAAVPGDHGDPRGSTVPYFITGRGTGTPFGPERAPPVTGSLSVVYWVPRAPPGSNPPSSLGLSTAPVSCAWREA